MIGCSVVIEVLRRCAGNAAVEFALIAPVLAATLVAMTDLGIGLYSKMQVENAAQAGAQYAIAKGWLWRHESGTYVKFTQAGADLSA